MTTISIKLNMPWASFFSMQFAFILLFIMNLDYWTWLNSKLRLKWLPEEAGHFLNLAWFTCQYAHMRACGDPNTSHFLTNIQNNWKKTPLCKTCTLSDWGNALSDDRIFKRLKKKGVPGSSVTFKTRQTSPWSISSKQHTPSQFW